MASVRPFVADHPVVQHELAVLRDAEASPQTFRQSLARVTRLLAAEATSDLQIESVHVQTPLAVARCGRLAERVALVPILRAGLGMVDPILDLLPESDVYHLGLYRDEATAQPVRYYEKGPPASPVDLVIILDPMLATGGSALQALETIAGWGVPRVKLISIIAAQDGVDTVVQKHPFVDIYVGAIDPALNDAKFIVPGLGDAGDRLFGTVQP